LPPGIDAAESPALLASLRQLMHLRSMAIAGQAAAIVVALALGVALPAGPMAICVGALVALNLFVSARLQRGTPATHREVAAYLAFDLAAFSALLLFAGGTENPFALVYLLHVVLIAMLLPWRLALPGTLLVIASFALAFLHADPLRLADGRPLPDTTMALALCASFTLTAAVIAWFIVRIVATLRAHERLLREAARRALNDEAVLRMGTLAAGAAHELGSPLTTMAVIVGEMRRDANTPARERDAGILTAQIDACRRSLANLRAAAGHVRADGGERERVDAFVASTLGRFRAMRPDVPLDVRSDGPAPAPEIFADPSLRQAILILLNNAADASPDRVDVEARWNGESLPLTVGDRGGGVPAGTLEKLGRAFFTTKPPGQGTGLGLVLTSSTVGRLGGTVRWANRPGGGLTAEIRVPLQGLAPAPPNR
jgi:two-component system sensor histidine kinase RegB